MSKTGTIINRTAGPCLVLKTKLQPMDYSIGNYWNDSKDKCQETRNQDCFGGTWADLYVTRHDEKESDHVT